MRRVANGESIEEMTLEQLNGEDATGVDVLGPIEVQRLSHEGRTELASLLNAVEQHGCWPAQVFATLGAVTPRPKGGGRIVGQLPFVTKTWSKLRGTATSRCSEELGEFWGTAIAGSSALQAPPAAPLFFIFLWGGNDPDGAAGLGQDLRQHQRPRPRPQRAGPEVPIDRPPHGAADVLGAALPHESEVAD